MSTTYADKLLDPRWQKKRILILQRDNFTCQMCGDTKNTLHVHHKFYIQGAEPWHYDDYSLITLCKDCHIACEYILVRKKLLLYRLHDQYPNMFKTCPACNNRDINSFNLNEYTCTLCGFSEYYCNLKNYEINAKN